MDWTCSKCGACCRAIKCPFLKDNLCTIYETRPPICRVGYSRKPGQDDASYKQEVEQACNTLQTLFPSEG